MTASHELLEESPLSSPIALRAALGEAARHFPPSDHEYILVTRSHGTDVMAITPALIEATLDRAVAANEKPYGTPNDSTDPLPLESDSSKFGGERSGTGILRRILRDRRKRYGSGRAG